MYFYLPLSAHTHTHTVSMGVKQRQCVNAIKRKAVVV